MECGSGTENLSVVSQTHTKFLYLLSDVLCLVRSKKDSHNRLLAQVNYNFYSFHLCDSLIISLPVKFSFYTFTLMSSSIAENNISNLTVPFDYSNCPILMQLILEFIKQLILNNTKWLIIIIKDISFIIGTEIELNSVSVRFII